MTRIDTQAIKQRVNLLELIGNDTTLKRVANTRGGEYAGPCPFCGGKDRLRVQPATGRWVCRQCGDVHHWPDAITYVQRRHNLDFRAACEWLNGGGDLPTGNAPATPRRRQPPVRVADPPLQDWQDAAGAVMLDCAFELFDDDGSKARAWLHDRGLKDETLARWYIGFNDARRTRHGLYVRRGITIPHYQRATDDVWALKIRRATGQPKYVNVKGSKPHLWGIDNLLGRKIAFLCEGEFDSLLLWQEAGDLVAVVAQGAATHHDLDTWLPYLLPIERLYVATDADAAGEQAAAYWLERTRRAHRVLPPLGQQDITDAHRAGAGLRAWVRQILETHP